MATTTTTYAFTKPTPGGDSDNWGGMLNGNWDDLDLRFTGTFESPAAGHLGTIRSTRIPSTIVGARTITSTAGGTLTVERTGEAYNATVAYTHDGGTVAAGHGVNGVFAIGSNTDLRDGLGNVTLRVDTANATLDMYGEISARTEGGSGRFFAAGYGTQSTPAYSFYSHRDAGVDHNSGIGVSIVVGGLRRLNVSDTVVQPVNGAAFTGSGSGLTGIPASAISSGTLADARIPNLAAGKITSGTFADARIPNLNASKVTAGTFNINRIPTIPLASGVSGTLPVSSGGTGGTTPSAARSNLGVDDASNLTSGVLNTARLAVSTQSRDWVLGRTAVAGVGVVGTYAYLRASSSARPASPGATRSGSDLSYSNANGSASGGSPSGTWRCMGDAGSTDTGGATLWLRIS